MVVATALFTLVPSVAIISTASGAGPFLHIPFGAITLIVVPGYGVAVGLIALIPCARHTRSAWMCAVIAVVTAAGAAVYPLIATAAALGQTVGGLLPALEYLAVSAGDLI